MKAGDVAKIIEGKLVGNPETSITGKFEFDSREIQKGDVFIALIGEFKDGHDFVSDAETGDGITLIRRQSHGHVNCFAVSHDRDAAL